jgi:hypothetical protein
VRARVPRPTMPAAVAARAGDGSPAAIAAKPVPGDEEAGSVADAWPVAPGMATEVNGPAVGATRWASAEATGAAIVVTVPPGNVLLEPGVLTVLPGAVPVLPGEVPVPPAAVPVLPGAEPVLPGEEPVVPGAVPVPPGAVPVPPGVVTVPPGAVPVPPGVVTVLPGGVTTACTVPSSWLTTEVTEVVRPPTVLVAVVTMVWVVPSS